MPSLTNVDLPCAFNYKSDVTIKGSAHFIPLSHPQISAPLNASSLPHLRKRPVNDKQLCQSHTPRDHPQYHQVSDEQPCPSHTLKHPPHHHPLQMTVAASSPLFLSTNNSLPQTHYQPPRISSLKRHDSPLHHSTTETPSLKAPHNEDWAHLPLTPRHHTHSQSGCDEDS